MIEKHSSIHFLATYSSKELLRKMRVTYLSVLTILAAAVASAGRIPIKNDEEILNNHRDVPNLIDQRFHNQQDQQPNDRHPAGNNEHRRFREHVKPPNFHTTERPGTEEIANATTTTSNPENTPASTITVISITTESESGSESEANENVVSTTELVTDVSAGAENVASTADSETETGSEASANAVSTTEVESVDDSTSTDSAVSTVDSKTEAVSVNNVNAVPTTESQSLVESATNTVGVEESESEDSSTVTTAVTTGSQLIAETTTTPKTWWRRLLFWQ